ncbi:DndE family protein [uncultured Salegentibacter sp.]|uniref:DndE family protein n=1 Tax=uncultured Salegentibacter sp. TaxID=259320 RepID=UPI00259770FF|nr:DndE family protein [uncultured Salegentibacter sp.]
MDNFTIKIDENSTLLLDRITSLYNFKRDTITGRIAFSLSINSGKKFHEDDIIIQDGRKYTNTSNLFGNYVNDIDNSTIFKAILDQSYSKELSQNSFLKLFRLHLKDGLEIWNNKLNSCDITKGEHISLLLKPIKKGLTLRSNTVKISTGSKKLNVKEIDNLLTFELGKTEDGENVVIKINDLREFDNRNIAIAGMAGSGKTQLMKDILYQISKNTSNELKFIFFDYKGEGNPEQLKPFLDATKCEFVDIVNDGGIEFNPFLSISLDERQRPFSIKAFVDTIATFVPSVGVAQKNILTNVITDLFDSKNGSYPTINELFENLEEYYEENNRRPDTLFAGIQDLTTNIFNCNPNNTDILDKSLYLNLPPALSDTLRQLVVFLLLRYFNSYFSSTNDCEPKEHIFPLRYVIVIDEAHIYLKNKNARKALEELLRLLRSKGVIIVMLSQGVEDYKTKDFDFASQVKLPICLNVQNKDYRAISNFVGTPSSKYKLETEIKKLESGKGLINIGEPKMIELRQWWKTKKDENI